MHDFLSWNFPYTCVYILQCVCACVYIVNSNRFGMTITNMLTSMVGVEKSPFDSCDFVPAFGKHEHEHEHTFL